MYDASYVPLEWSDSLAQSAEKYAMHLALFDKFEHSYGTYGENLAMNWGWGSTLYTSAASADDVLNRWVEEEESYWRGHFSQVLWRATLYVGCGTFSITEGQTHYHYQVCQYLTPGNCNGSFKANMLALTSPCNPQSPDDEDFVPYS